jgi:hypothetical protein
MHPTRRVLLEPGPDARAAIAVRPEQTDDITSLLAQRERVVAALEQTRAARKSGVIVQTAATTLKQLEMVVVGQPESTDAGIVLARVVAAGDADTRLSAVPLAGLTVRLRIKENVVVEETTNALGLALLQLPKNEAGCTAARAVSAIFSLADTQSPKDEAGTYKVEVLAPDCTILACQAGRWQPRQPAPVHLVELARTENLKPHIERASPLQKGIRQARERASLAREVVAAALKAQETRLIEYLAEIDAALACEPKDQSGAPAKTPPQSSARPIPNSAPVVGETAHPEGGSERTDAIKPAKEVPTPSAPQKSAKQDKPTTVRRPDDRPKSK